MKKSILALSIATCVTLVCASNAFAKPQQASSKHYQANASKQMMRDIRKLDLSDTQKQEVQNIIKTTKENNSVYAGEKQEIRQQMQDLMNMPSWDAGTAESIIRAQMEQAQAIELNRAKARHQIYNLLSQEQQVQLTQNKESRKDKMARKRADAAAKKGERNGKKKNRSSKMAKALRLTEEQKTEIQSLRENAKMENSQYKEQAKAQREAMRAIIQAPSFDEDAWLLQQTQFADEKVALRLAQTKLKFDTLALLDDKQKAKFKKMMKKMKDKRA